MWHLECLPPSRENLSVSPRLLAWQQYGHLVNVHDSRKGQRAFLVYTLVLNFEGYLIGQIQEETIHKNCFGGLLLAKI